MWIRFCLLALVVLVAACARDAGPEQDAAMDTAMVPAAPVPPPAPVDTTPRPVLPRFEDYAVEDVYRGRPAPVDLASAEYGRTFRTMLREGARSGPNFAGRYTIVEWGCGTGCQIVVVVDARTGRLSRQSLNTASGVEYRLNSALLIADPPDPANPWPPGCASCGTTAAYVWKGDRFEPVGEGPHPHLEGQRPW